MEDDSQLDAAFPLRVATQATRDRRGAPRYLARRLRAADDRDSLFEDAVRSLNSLAEARGNGRFARWPVRRIGKDKLTEGELLALSRVGGALRGSLPRPAERDICADGAFCELLKCRNFHDTDQSVSAAEYDPSQVRVLVGRARRDFIQCDEE